MRIRVAVEPDGRCNFEGRIAGLEQALVLPRGDDALREIPLAMIESARLVPEF